MSLLMLNDKDPAVLRGMYAYRREVFKDKALSAKEKELIALALSAATKCETCLEYHAEAARKEGATSQEILEALEVTAYMTGPSALIWSERIDDIVNP